ncbi:hypothetical protein K1719_043547 [Acacia pycnantha]|nr:hypothetical protein K1719_043547 [Acacia pycnantha]
MMLCKQKKDLSVWNIRKMLISVNVQGSTGPIRFVVRKETIVMQVITTALKIYARVGRLPVLGCEIGDFLLYCPIVGSEAIGPWDTIGSVEGRNFLLCKKTDAEHGRPQTSPKDRANLKAWFHKSSIHSHNISSH